ncbi:MAG TPA: transketolase C-terminal domain-containing protein [Bryobacteraceae bacterium]
MRKAFVATLCELAATDDRIMLLTGDLGFMALEPFRERFPNRFLNVGAAEQNMIGVATGLAEAGFLPYAYSIATFASLRPFEFIRNGPVLHRLPVRIVGMGMGFEYGHSGHTHYALEDVAALRTLPGLTIVVPADSGQTKTSIRVTHDLPGPVYYSLGKDDQIVVPGLNGQFELGRVCVAREGRHLAFVTVGSVAQEVLAAAAKLAQAGIEAAVIVVANFHPDPEDHLASILSSFDEAITVEAQTPSGGLGAFVATVVATRGLRCRLRIIGVGTAPDGTSGSQIDRWRKYGLDRESLVATVVGESKLVAEAGRL